MLYKVIDMATAIPATTSGGVPVIILKEGAKETKGRDAQKNNIAAAKLVAELLKSALGPRGMDKMLVDTLGPKLLLTISATIFAAVMLFFCASLPLVCDVPSFRIKTGTCCCIANSNHHL